MASAESRHESVRAPGEHYRVAGFACLICPGRGCRGKWVLKDRTRTQARDLELCAFRTQRQVRSFVPDILGYKSCLSPQYMLSYWIKLVLRPINRSARFKVDSQGCIITITCSSGRLRVVTMCASQCPIEGA